MISRLYTRFIVQYVKQTKVGAFSYSYLKNVNMDLLTEDTVHCVQAEIRKGKKP